MWNSIKNSLLVALLCSLGAAHAQVQLVLTEGGVEKTCTTVGDVVVSTGQVRAQVQAGCLEVPDGGGGVPAQYALSVTVQGSGTVTSNPAGINCGAQCSGNFDSASNVVLTAAPAAGWNFTAWTGCSSQSGTSCTVTMANNRAVTATFTAQSGGGGGADPLTPVWKPNATTYVFDRGAWTEQFVPRCVPDQYNNCRYGGSRSLYDTVKVGEVWSMRVPYGVGTFYATHSFQIARSETGESLNNYDISLSTTPGDFDSVTGGCRKLNSTTLSAYDPATGTPSWGSHCQLAPNTLYYLNVRPAVGTAGATRCGGSSADACRFRIVLPSGFTYSN
ncbi:hypothetical protein IAI53_00230 [Thauera sp. CAU 1555]|uniref:Bacterial repeat domain-containing protein n=1 Tax=Thauera sedimentorum TaxID=2767595 RepID=A0ABR9B4M3_9RHOO|nr:hypothetical protein [Thauera sedimentorum]MBC9070389.1 hypothetical protein [Thauera sedimentorum]MBD8501309.1 hypothetical protein [Thauera sedimentorum]